MILYWSSEFAGIFLSFFSKEKQDKHIFAIKCNFSLIVCHVFFPIATVWSWLIFTVCLSKRQPHNSQGKLRYWLLKRPQSAPWLTQRCRKLWERRSSTASTTASRECVEMHLITNQVEIWSTGTHHAIFNLCGRLTLFVAVSVSQRSTAVVTGTAGCAGATLQWQHTPHRTAPIISPTLTRQVSCTTPETLI